MAEHGPDGAPGAEVDLAGREALEAVDPHFVEELEAERSLWRSVIWGTIIATPVCIAIWMLIVVLAVGGDDPDWGSWLGIGAIVGVLAGAFFGGWAGFTVKAHLLDDVDHRAAHRT